MGKSRRIIGGGKRQFDPSPSLLSSLPLPPSTGGEGMSPSVVVVAAESPPSVVSTCYAGIRRIF